MASLPSNGTKNGWRQQQGRDIPIWVNCSKPAGVHRIIFLELPTEIAIYFFHRLEVTLYLNTTLSLKLVFSIEKNRSGTTLKTRRKSRRFKSKKTKSQTPFKRVKMIKNNYGGSKYRRLGWHSTRDIATWVQRRLDSRKSRIKTIIMEFSQVLYLSKTSLVAWSKF